MRGFALFICIAVLLDAHKHTVTLVRREAVRAAYLLRYFAAEVLDEVRRPGSWFRLSAAMHVADPSSSWVGSNSERRRGLSC